jgi:hypothetical protein
MQKVRAWFDLLFPEQEIDRRKLTWQQSLQLAVGFAVIFYCGGLLLRPNEYVGFDWQHFFGAGRIPPFYPPWAAAVGWLNWPLLLGLSGAVIGLAVVRRAAHPLSAAAVLASLPLLWTLFLGQLDGLVLLGLSLLPLLTPLALLKPQVALFAFAARKRYLLALLLWLVLSFIIWGWWPGPILAVNSFHAEGRFVQNIAIGWVGVLLAAPMGWLSRGDLDMLMLSGAVMTPYLIPYNFMPVVPAAARLKPWQAWAAALLSWLPFSANWLGDVGWWFGWVYVFWLWACLAVQRYRRGVCEGKGRFF